MQSALASSTNCLLVYGIHRDRVPAYRKQLVDTVADSSSLERLFKLRLRTKFVESFFRIPDRQRGAKFREAPPLNIFKHKL